MTCVSYNTLPGLDARRLRYLLETFDITCHKSTDLLRRVIHHDAQPGRLEGASFGASYDGPKPFVQSVDYEIGRFAAHEDRGVGVIDELRKTAFLHSRHFGSKGMTFLGRYCERTQPPLLDERQRSAGINHSRWNLATHHICHHLRGALVRHRSNCKSGNGAKPHTYQFVTRGVIDYSQRVSRFFRRRA